MKIFINTTSWAIVKQENETPILAGNNYVDQLEVYYDSNPSTQYFYPLLNILKPNDRKVGLISFDATSVEEPNPSTYTDDDNNTWYMFKFTLSSDNHQIDVSGKYQFTITTNYYNSTTGVILKQRNINTILSVVNAVTNDDNSVLILGDEPGVVVAELYALCQSLQTGVASLQISVSALQSSKADLNNPSQDIVAGSITAENGYIEDLISEYGAQITLDSVFGGISFKPVGSSKYITIGDGKISGVDTVSGANDVTNKNYVDTKDATKADLTNGNQTITAEQITVDKVVGKYAGSNIGFDEYQSGEIIMSFANGTDPLFFSDGAIDGINMPTSNNQATSKIYVDTGLAGKGNKIDLEIDSDYKLKAKLYNGTTLLSTSTVIDLPLESVVVSGEYDATNKKVILTLEDGSTIEFSVADLISGLQSEINANNKLSSDFVDDTNNTHKFVTAEEKQQIQTNADNIALHDTALNNRYTKTETDTLLATKQDVLSGSESVDINSNVVSVKEKGITGDKLDLLSISNIKNLATNNCGNIHNDTAPAWLTLRSYNFNIEQGKTYLMCAMFKKNANHTDSTTIASNLRYSGTTYSNYESIASNVLPITDEYKVIYRVFKANETKTQYFQGVFYRSSAYTQENIIDIDVKSMFVCEIPDTYSYIDIMDVVKQYDYLSNLDYLSNIQEIKNNFWDDKTILCYGDSLTQGAGGSGTTYPSELQTLLGSNYKVSNRGVGGETALQIGARQGGIQTMLQPMEITTSYKDCEYKSIIGNTTLAPLGYQSNADNTINPVMVNGISCNIYFSSSTQARIQGSKAFTITRPMPLLPASTKDFNKTLILWVGQNGWGSNDYNDLVNIIKNMVEYNKNDKYLIIGLSTGTATSRADLEDLMVHSFGNHYINIRQYLVSYGLDDNGLTPTEQDTTDISNGTVPTSLRSDGTHLNSYGYKSVAKCVYQYGKNNNLW